MITKTTRNLTGLAAAGLLSLSAWALPPTPPTNTSALVISWTPSPSDTGTNGGFYSIVALPTNAPSILGALAITNVPAGATNVWIPAAALPGNPCFVFAQFSQLGMTSALTGPLWVDTNSIYAWQPLPAAALKVGAK